MDESGFRELLESRGLAPEEIDRSVGLVGRFEDFLRRFRPASAASRATAGDVLRFVEELGRTGEGSVDHVLAIARYARLSRNDEALVAALEMIDGAEVPENLSSRLAEIAGEGIRDEVFAGLEVPPVWATPADKNAFMRELVARLSGRIDEDTLETVLNGNLHFIPGGSFTEERERFVAASDLDWFIADEHRRYVEYLAGLRDAGTLYFSQPITDDVVAYVRDTPTCGGGVRRGDRIHVTKIPYQADAYLHETDEARKRYFCCHCMWARESILHPETGVSPRFCQCSAGFEKQYWDAVLDQPVRVDVVRSVLRGDLVCEFAVHLPEEIARGS